jgi:hypothetical protein
LHAKVQVLLSHTGVAFATLVAHAFGQLPQ